MSYEEHLNRIYHGDTLVLMKNLPDSCIDLIIVDSPYGMNYQSNRRVVNPKFDIIHNDEGTNFEELMINFFKESKRILKPNTAIYSFCSWHNVGFFQETLSEHFDLKNLIVWVKNNHGTGDLEGSYSPRHELVWFAHKGRRPLKAKPRPDDVQFFDKVDQRIINHPTPKPTDLIKLFITASSSPGDIVFDGFVGSGTTAIAAKELGRNFIGAELDKTYHEMATDAFNNTGSYDNF